MQESTYVASLYAQAKRRYLEKLSCVGLSMSDDPYLSCNDRKYVNDFDMTTEHGHASSTAISSGTSSADQVCTRKRSYSLGSKSILITFSKLGTWGLYSPISLGQARRWFGLKPKWILVWGHLMTREWHGSFQREMAKLYVHNANVWQGKQLWQCHCVVCWSIFCYCVVSLV